VEGAIHGTVDPLVAFASSPTRATASFLRSAGGFAAMMAGPDREAAGRGAWQIFFGLEATVIGGRLGGSLVGAGERAVAERAALSRLPQDVAVNPRAPAALPLNRPISQSVTQNAVVQQRIQDLINRGARDIRVNQQQLNINGLRTGINRPDLQYTLNGVRFYEEFETRSLVDAWAHAWRILANDPVGQFIPWFVP
jgi:hypothetical protein